MSEKETKRQHYVPRAYLKNFSIKKGKGFFTKVVPVKELNENKIIESNITNICLQSDLYTLTGTTEKERLFLENFYSDNFESHFTHVYNILIDPTKKEVTTGERELIISTVVTMLYRTTKWLNTHNEFTNRVIERIYQLCQETEKDYYIEGGKKISIAGKTLEQLKQENITNNREAQVLIQLDVALKLIELRKNRDGIFVITLIDDNLEFITSDNPVIYSNPNEKTQIAPFDPSNILKLPLDNKHILYLMPYPDPETQNLIMRSSYKHPSATTEKMCSNYEQFQNAERFIIGSEYGIKDFLNSKNTCERNLSNEEEQNIVKSIDEIKRKLKNMGLI